MKNLFFAFCLCAFTNLFALQIPGTIDREYQGFASIALDLSYQNKLLSQIEADQLVNSGLDLSNLDPVASDIWSENKKAYVNTFESFASDESVTYLAPVASRTGNFRFSTVRDGAFGKQSFIFMVSKRVHNVLLRAKLLQKLGYAVPQVSRVPRIQIKFGSPFEKENFLTQLAEDTFADPARWVVENEEGSKEIVLQDVIVMSADQNLYNLSLGTVPSHIINGRRVLNSLLVPFALTNVPESVNLYSWSAGRVINNSIKLDYDDSSEFTTTIEDARWIAKKISKLTRQDFVEIVAEGNYPASVAKLLVEKLIERRNSLCRLFDLSLPQIPYDLNLTQKPDLKDGKLITENWPGYGSRFSYGDPESPLSGSEMFAFFKSKALSTLIENAVSLFNQYALPNTDLKQQIIDKQMEIANEQFLEFLETGEMKQVPFGLWAVPTIGANIIASREIIAGSYMGTDNIVQLADTIGLNMSLGAYIGTQGVPVPYSLSGGANAYVTRSFTHLRPIYSMKKALKEPLKNILVPLVTNKFGTMFEDIAQGKFETLDQETKQKKLKEVMTTFKDNMEVGESIIISDTIGGGANISGGYQLTKLISAQVQFSGSQVVLSRLHILRSAKDKIQIYKDLGNIGRLGVTFGLRALIPVITISFTGAKAAAITKYHQLNLPDDNEEQLDDQVVLTAQALRALFLENSLELVNMVSKPYVIEHKIIDNSSNISFLFWKWKRQNTNDLITVAHPDGPKKNYYRRVVGKRTGRDYQDLFANVVTGLLAEYTETELVLSSGGNGNPGDSFMGKSVTRQTTFEGELVNYNESDKKKGRVKKPFIALTYVWKGWHMTQKAFKKVVGEINSNLGFHFYPDSVLSQTQSLQLYNINLGIYFYEKAFEHILSLSKSSVTQIINQYGNFKVTPICNFHGNHFIDVGFETCETYSEAKGRLVSGFASQFENYKKKYNKYLAKNDLDRTSQNGVRIVSLLEEVLPYQGLIAASGGDDAIYIVSTVNGFRKGDEGGDIPLISDSIGEFGDKDILGPLMAMKNKIGISDAEFYVNWLVGRL